MNKIKRSANVYYGRWEQVCCKKIIEERMDGL
jgi:hypothetical protein